jgi:hypothetical protein
MIIHCQCGVTFRKARVFPVYCGCGRIYKLIDGVAVESGLVDYERTNQPAAACSTNNNTSEPSMLVKAAKFAAANRTWATAGFPVRTAEQKATISVICSGCEFYNAAKHKCTKCGCFLSMKIHMATEKCPVDKW